MPKDSTRRQRPVSCHFCRTRKLRCSRTQPCSNCLSRGITCRLDEDPSLPSSSTAVSPANQAQSDILDRLHRLERIVSQYPFSTGSSRTEQAQAHLTTPSPASTACSATPHATHLDEDVAYLERVSRSSNCHLQDAPSARIVVRIGPRPVSTSNGQPKSIWLPRYEDFKLLVNRDISYGTCVHHVIHVPSIRTAVEEVFAQTSNQQPPKPGYVMLLLSLLASATYMWTPESPEPPLFSSLAEANRETQYCIQAALDVLDEIQRGSPSLEAVQGIIILSFVIGNLGGVTLRFRSLYSTALLIARELGLHRIDHPSNSKTANTVAAEVGRRVWWYLVATDWLLAARFNGPAEGVYQCQPRHMIVRLPRNIDDEHLSDGVANGGEPASQPTVASYSLQRIRLAEICRNHVDRNPYNATTSTAQGYTNIMTADAELDEFLHSIPTYFRMGEAIAAVAGSDPPLGIIFQAYMLNSHVHIQKLKLHLPYLTSHTRHPMYAFSREACVSSARHIVQLEKLVEEIRHPLSVLRLRLIGSLYGLFMASVVLLMDVCMNRSEGPIDLGRGEVADAFRMLEDARLYTKTAENLLQALVQVLRKHGVSPPEPRARSQVGNVRVGCSDATTSNSNTLKSSYDVPTSLLEDKPSALNGGNSAFDDLNARPDGTYSYFDELALSLGGRTDLDPFLWDEIFSEIDTSFF